MNEGDEGERMRDRQMGRKRVRGGEKRVDGGREREDRGGKGTLGEDSRSFGDSPQSFLIVMINVAQEVTRKRRKKGMNEGQE